VIHKSEYAFFNDPHFNNFVQYLQQSNKIAVIFATCKDGYGQIPDSPLIIKYVGLSVSEKLSKIQELRDEFYKNLNAYEAEFNHVYIAKEDNLLTSVRELIVDVIDVDFIDMD
jgi:hypothetical protein